MEKIQTAVSYKVVSYMRVLTVFSVSKVFGGTFLKIFIINRPF